MLIESRRTGEVIPGRHSVASALLEIEDARRLLTQVLGVGEPDASTWKKSLVEAFEAATSLNPGPDGIRSKALDWENFWLRLRSAPVEVAKNFLTDIAGRSVGPRRHMIKVRREDGNWVDWHRTCLPGGVIKSKDDPQNRALAVDSWHLPMDMELFETLGVGQKPKKMIQETAGSNRLSWTNGFPQPIGIIVPPTLSEVLRKKDIYGHSVLRCRLDGECCPC